ncbi:OLC1v1016126C1 [Oldenlandia corymbosa var. corymbosa]|uniref:OLC1v1016126C1 n=1 Tax=Oldenlandia corymbosa var. corymbosa TaxID=529605 RepID=A0AAV1E530_OLDCO|nr:OLC1v1016126C1 [Oldenlandia corymbosa var. corymbosa]
MEPPLNLRVLSTLDAAKVQYYHFRAIVVAGMGLFTDAYDFFCISPIMQLIGYVYYYDDDGDKRHHPLLLFTDDVPAVVTSFLVSITLLGTVVGQLLFGRLGDLMGRRKVYGFALMIMVFSSIACGFSVGRCRSCVLISLGLFRFSLGVGIGGDYPLSATIMSEFANRSTRGAFIAAVFSMQGFGILVGSTVIMVTCAVFNRASGHPDRPAPEVVDLAWRVILMIGAIPAGLTFYWRMTMPETARYTALIENNVVKATKDMQKVFNLSLSPIAEEPDGEEDDQINPESQIPTTSSSTSSYPLFSKEFLHRHGRDLFSCSLAWFLVDVVFYSNNLLQSHIYKRCLDLGSDHLNAYDAAFRVAKLQGIIAVCSTIPGYFVSVYFIDRIGRVPIQMAGFFFTAIWLFAIGIPYYSYWRGSQSSSSTAGFMTLYGLIFFSSNFGPNTTTFIVPAELFPARFRSTCHGISGAAGKVGAIIGAVGFLWASHGHAGNGYGKGLGMRASLIILGIVSLIGCAGTWLFMPETMGRSLEDNEEGVIRSSPQPRRFSFLVRRSNEIAANA